MRKFRRSFLKSAGGLLLAAAVPAPFLRNTLSLNHLPALDLLDIAIPAEWSCRMHFAEWTGCLADIQSICIDGAVPLAEDIPAIMRRHLEGRARVVGHDFRVATDDPAPDMKLKFVRYGANGHMLLMDVHFNEGYRIVVLPGDRVSANKVWLDAGMSFEEYLSRALIGSFLNDFPMNLDMTDLVCVLTHGKDSEENVRDVSVISLSPILRGNTRAAMQETMHDTNKTLQRLGYPGPDGFFLTYHGPDMDDTFWDVCRQLAEVTEDQTCFVGQDWDDTLPNPFVSVIAHGLR